MAEVLRRLGLAGSWPLRSQPRLAETVRAGSGGRPTTSASASSRARASASSTCCSRSTAHPRASTFGRKVQVVSVTYVKAGKALDATPASVEFGGTLRSITTEGLYRLQKRVKEVVERQAAVHRCEGTVDMKGEEYPMYPAVVNDWKMHHHVEDVGRRLLGRDKVKPGEKIMAGEDFAFYQQLAPGVMFGIGIRNEKVGSIHSAHNPRFFVDEDVIPIGAALHTAISELYLSEAYALNGGDLRSH